MTLDTPTNSGKNPSPRGGWRDYLPLMRADMLLASFAVNMLSLALPLVVLQVYDRIIPNASYGTLGLLVAALGIVLVVDLVLKTARTYLAGWSGAKFEHQAATGAVDKLLRADLRHVEATPAGVHLDRISSVEPVRDFYASQAAMAVVDLPFVLIFLAILGLIAGSLMLIPLILLILFGAAAAVLGAKLRAALTHRATWDDRRYNFIIEVLRGIHTVKGLAMERLMERRYERLMESAARSGHWVVYYGALAQGIGATFSQITMGVVAAAGSLYVISGDISIGALAACILLAGRTVQPILRALGLWTRFQSIRIAEGRLQELDDMPIEGTGGTVPVTSFAPITLENASFSYDPDGKPLFQNLNLTIDEGETIGIRGGNGVGKTTLLWMLMGGLLPSSGTIRIGGVSTHEMATETLREQTAFLPQSPVLFQGTVMDNITMFRGDEWLEEAHLMAERLGLDEIFARMPDGYETLIGAQAGDILPVGIIQRIAIARVLLGQPKLILFDEANSALDAGADDRVRHLLSEYQGRSTIILVSYRPSLLRLADRQFDLRDGGLFPAGAAGGTGFGAKGISA